MHHLVAIAIATDVQLDWLGTGRGSPAANATREAASADYILDGVDRDLIKVIVTLSGPLKLALLKLAKAMVIAIHSA